MLSAYMADCNSNVIIPAPYDTPNSERNEWTIDWTGWDGAISIRWNVRSSSSRESQLQQHLLLNNLAINYLWNSWYNKKIILAFFSLFHWKYEYGLFIHSYNISTNWLSFSSPSHVTMSVCNRWNIHLLPTRPAPGER